MGMGVKFLRGGYGMVVEKQSGVRRCASENPGKVYVSLYLRPNYCSTTLHNFSLRPTMLYNHAITSRSSPIRSSI